MLSVLVYCKSNRDVRSPGDGSAYGERLFEKHFAAIRETIPELAGVTFHRLRATRVIELRQRGATTLQIQDQVGMSIGMVERYCRFADRKANGQAAVVALQERRRIREL